MPVPGDSPLSFTTTPIRWVTTEPKRKTTQLDSLPCAGHWGISGEEHGPAWMCHLRRQQSLSTAPSRGTRVMEESSSERVFLLWLWTPSRPFTTHPAAQNCVVFPILTIRTISKCFVIYFSGEKASTFLEKRHLLSTPDSSVKL